MKENLKENSDLSICELFKESYDLMKEGNLRELKIQKKGVKIFIKRASAEAKKEAQIQPEAEIKTTKTINAPLSGIFYARPNPDASPFITPPCSVKKGTPLCIIEAMKVMNKIDCPFDAVIKETLVTNGQAVTKGAPLFRCE